MRIKKLFLIKSRLRWREPPLQWREPQARALKHMRSVLAEHQ